MSKVRLGDNNPDIKPTNMIRFAIGDNAKDITLRNVELSWAEFKVGLSKPVKKRVRYDNRKVNLNTNEIERNKETGEPNYLSYQEAIKQAISIEKLKLKYFIGGYFSVLKRKNENVEARTLIVLDIDSFSKDIDQLSEILKSELGRYDYIAYSTASHTPKKPCVRVILRCDEEIKGELYQSISKNFIDKLTFKDAIDVKASTIVSQAMYLPAIIEITDQPEGEEKYEYEYWIQENGGEAVNIKDFSTSIIEMPIITSGGIASDDVCDYSYTPINTEKVVEYLKEYPAKNLDYHGWLEVSMALHHNYKGSDKGYKIWDRWSAVDVDRYDLVKNKQIWKSFKSKDKLKTFASIIKKVNEQEKTNWQKDILAGIRDLKERFNEKEELMPIICGIAKHCSTSEAEYYIREIKDSTKLAIGALRSLVTKEQKKIAVEESKLSVGKIFKINEELPRVMFADYIDSDKPPKTTLPNFEVILKAYNISIKRNLISREEEINIPGQTYCADTKLNASYNQLVSICEMNGLHKNNLINGYCSNIGSKNVYNPVLDFIKSKPWDGIDRIEGLLETIVVKDGYNTALKNLLVKKWLISAVAVLCSEKGTKTKGVLILQGGQSGKKSYWFEKLIPKELKDYYCEGLQLNTRDKDSIAISNSNWIAELGEFEGSISSRNIASLKAFISNDKSMLRRAYAAKNEVFYRRSVFCGTVNPEEFLTDRTGNVRFWVISVIDLLCSDHIDKQQLWAQVFNLFESGEHWMLSLEEENLLEASNESFLETCPYEEMIVRYIKPYSKNITTCPEINRKTATQILLQIKEAWGIGVNIDQRATRAVASALNRLGFKRELGNRKRFYVEAV